MTETEINGERLSALVDGELTQAEYRDAVEAIHQSAELKHRWMRYHLATDALKNSLPPAIVKPDFAGHVMQAIEAEPTVLAPRNILYRVRVVAKQMAGLAVAASVTAVAVLGIQTWRLHDTAPVVAQQESAPVVAQGVAPGANEIRPVTAVATENAPVPAHVQLQINQYLLNHNQNALGAQRMLPYARIVGHTSGDVAE